MFKLHAGNAVRLPVETGIGADDRIEVTAAELNVGDRVVVRGAELLRDGQPVLAE